MVTASLPVYRKTLVAISKKFLNPIYALGHRFKPSKYLSISAGYDPQRVFDQAGSPAGGETWSRLAGSEHVEGTLGSTPIFEMAYSNYAQAERRF